MSCNADTYRQAAIAFTAARRAAKKGLSADAGYWFDIGRRAVTPLLFDRSQLTATRNSLRMPSAPVELQRCRMIANQHADTLMQELAGHELRHYGVLLAQRGRGSKTLQRSHY